MQDTVSRLPSFLVCPCSHLWCDCDHPAGDRPQPGLGVPGHGHHHRLGRVSSGCLHHLEEVLCHRCSDLVPGESAEAWFSCHALRTTSIIILALQKDTYFEEGFSLLFLARPFHAIQLDKLILAALQPSACYTHARAGWYAISYYDLAGNRCHPQRWSRGP